MSEHYNASIRAARRAMEEWREDPFEETFEETWDEDDFNEESWEESFAESWKETLAFCWDSCWEEPSGEDDYYYTQRLYHEWWLKGHREMVPHWWWCKDTTVLQWHSDPQFGADHYFREWNPGLLSYYDADVRFFANATFESCVKEEEGWTTEPPMENDAWGAGYMLGCDDDEDEDAESWKEKWDDWDEDEEDWVKDYIKGYTGDGKPVRARKERQVPADTEDYEKERPRGPRQRRNDYNNPWRRSTILLERMASQEMPMQDAEAVLRSHGVPPWIIKRQLHNITMRTNVCSMYSRPAPIVHQQNVVDEDGVQHTIFVLKMSSQHARMKPTCSMPASEQPDKCDRRDARAQTPRQGPPPSYPSNTLPVATMMFGPYNYPTIIVGSWKHSQQNHYIPFIPF